MAVITPWRDEWYSYGFNKLFMTKTLYIRFLHMQNASVWWLGRFHCCCHSNITVLPNWDYVRSDSHRFLRLFGLTALSLAHGIFIIHFSAHMIISDYIIIMYYNNQQHYISPLLGLKTGSPRENQHKLLSINIVSKTIDSFTIACGSSQFILRRVYICTWNIWGWVGVWTRCYIIIFLFLIIRLLSLEHWIHYFEMRHIASDILAISTCCNHRSIRTHDSEW